MKKLYFLVVIVISFATQAQIVNIPDANFKARLLSASPSNQIASTQTPIFGQNNYNITIYETIDTNNDGEIQVSEASVLKYLDLETSNISSLIGIEAFTNLVYLNCNVNSLVSLDITQNSNLKYFECFANSLTSLNVTQNLALEYLFCASNQLSSLNITQNAALTNLNFNNNSLSSVDLSHNFFLRQLGCSNNQLTTIDLSNNSLLDFFWCNNNQLTSLDLSFNPLLFQFRCQNNLLLYLILKNNNFSSMFMPDFSNNPTLSYICTNEADMSLIQSKINQYGYNNCELNSYCSFIPDNNYFVISGENHFTTSNCNNINSYFSNVKYNISNGSGYSRIVSNASGSYSVPVLAGNYTITPIFENSNYFNITPTSFVANFPTQSSPLIQDFCIKPNGVHHDVEVTIIPTNPARPGFDANYSIIYKNKGNQVENGDVSLTYFENTVLDLVSTNPSFSTQTSNTLVWNYTNLQPFETRTIDIIFNINSPMETPAVNIGDQLNYTATITPTVTDEYQFDNSSTLKQIVVGSYDPNDKTCIEGTTVGPAMIGHMCIMSFVLKTQELMLQKML